MERRGGKRGHGREAAGTKARKKRKSPEGEYRTCPRVPALVFPQCSLVAALPHRCRAKTYEPAATTGSIRLHLSASALTTSLNRWPSSLSTRAQAQDRSEERR